MSGEIPDTIRTDGEAPKHIRCSRQIKGVSRAHKTKSSDFGCPETFSGEPHSDSAETEKFKACREAPTT